MRRYFFRSLAPTRWISVALALGLAIAPLSTSAFAAPGKKAAATKLAADKAGITVSSMTKGAKIFIDDKEVGEVPLDKTLEVEPNKRHTVRVQKRGFSPFVETVLPSGGQLIEIEADLVAVSAALRIASLNEALKLQILVDGRVAGFTPFDGDVNPGSHSIEARATGYLAETQMIDAKPGQDLQLEFGLKVVPAPLVKEDKSLLSRWWFWTAVGVVVVGGVTGGLVAAQDTHLAPKTPDHVLPLQ